MSLEELRDYAVQLEQDKSAKEQALTEKDATITELKDDIVGLQRRNNNLFMQVEQQTRQPAKSDLDDQEGKEEISESLEDFARKNYKEYIK